MVLCDGVEPPVFLELSYREALVGRWCVVLCGGVVVVVCSGVVVWCGCLVLVVWWWCSGANANSVSN